MGILETTLKSQAIETPTLTVKDNVIGFQDYFIQISNISEAEIAPIPKLPYSVIAIILVIAGTLLFISGIEGHPFSIIIGLILAAIGLIPIYSVYKKNKNRGEVLILGLNSGKYFHFRCYDRDFMRKVLEVLKSCVNVKGQNVTVDFSNSIISNSPMVSGSHNNIEVGV